MVGNIPPAHKLYPTAFESVQDGYLDIMGEKYKVSGYYGGVGMYMLWGTQPDNINVGVIEIQMEDIVTDEQAEEILALYNECFDMLGVQYFACVQIYAVGKKTQLCRVQALRFREIRVYSVQRNGVFDYVGNVGDNCLRCIRLTYKACCCGILRHFQRYL